MKLKHSTIFLMLVFVLFLGYFWRMHHETIHKGKLITTEHKLDACEATKGVLAGMYESSLNNLLIITGKEKRDANNSPKSKQK